MKNDEKAKKKRKIAVLCDFDGTIVKVDTGELVLEKFGQGDWQSLDLKLEREEIPLEDCLIEQYGMIRAPREKILEMLEQEEISIRNHFPQFVEYCRKNGYELVVTTGGIDFCIEQILKSHGLNGILKIHAGKTVSTKKEGILINFPKLSEKRSINFKEDLLNHCHDLGYLAVYIGDGSSDYVPARKADLVFSVTQSKLSKMCDEKKISHIDFSDFEEVIHGLEDKLPRKLNEF
jgi:2-hydroxy-3-keto-5-methylthiopentenyl-1-phosphate phosphatase